MAYQRAKEARDETRASAAAAWGAGDEVTRQRTAMVIAAFHLDQAQHEDLADLLLLARPEHARAVATGVAVLALLRGCLPVWASLEAVDAMDPVRGFKLLVSPDNFEWSPQPEWLYPSEDTP